MLNTKQQHRLHEYPWPDYKKEFLQDERFLQLVQQWLDGKITYSYLIENKPNHDLRISSRIKNWINKPSK